MTTLTNTILISAPVDKIWQALAALEDLDKYDPNVKKSIQTSSLSSGLGASRKVHMKDGKNWFAEKITDWQPNTGLSFELTDCSFPINSLKYRYDLEPVHTQTKITQIMEYEVKFGLLGKMMDTLMIRKQFSAGVKIFLNGLKIGVEQQNKVLTGQIN